uniref:Uncharacterized protein n=1 Tax=Gossypium raimondii TaxID=29730 RepID=A0A0D2T9A9_GOSRA|nr:hypothetical protein B456_007G053600 [Gossypium raimondii]
MTLKSVIKRQSGSFVSYNTYIKDIKLQSSHQIRNWLPSIHGREKKRKFFLNPKTNLQLCLEKWLYMEITVEDEQGLGFI